MPSVIKEQRKFIINNQLIITLVTDYHYCSLYVFNSHLTVTTLLRDIASFINVNGNHLIFVLFSFLQGYDYKNTSYWEIWYDRNSKVFENKKN